MAEPGAPSARVITSVNRARAVALTHSCVDQAAEPVAVGDSMRLELVIAVPMPNAWLAKGESPSGVKRLEPVRLDFPPGYPVDPPEISLREDFRRDIAHVQPWLHDGRPVPCIQDGKMSEFMQHEGIAGILNQTVQWLENAAEGNLIDPDQGWEPSRRDDVADTLVADADALRGVVSRSGGQRFQTLQYIRREQSWLIGQVPDGQLGLNKKTIQHVVYQKSEGDGFYFGRSLALIAWPGKQPSGKPVICNKYVPDTVRSLQDLKQRAREFGCLEGLITGLGRIAECVQGCAPAGPFPLAIVLCARRPFNLIGSASAIELCFYTLDFHSPAPLPHGDETPVRPAAHREQVTPALLAKLSGIPLTNHQRPWTLIGAGSLGSKIGLHMGRAGRGPSAIIDPSIMAPHNAARHAMIPHTGDIQIMSMDPKARQLSRALAGLAQDSIAITEDVVHVLATRQLAKQAWDRRSWAVVNTTASLRVRAALCSSALPHRMVESLLYAEGRLGLIVTEGPGRDPDVGDLVTEFYALGLGDAMIAPLLYPGTEQSELVRVSVGEGCGSATMQVSDGRISLYAAGVSEYLLAREDQGLPERGELLIGKLTAEGMGVDWEHHAVAPTTVIAAENGTGWHVRINERAAAKINADIALWPGVETGGVLLGRQDEATQSFYVVDVLPAPEDSVRSAAEFTLGVKGLRKALEDYMRATNVTLYCLGTWHSHLADSGPSPLDRQTARAMGLARLAPSVLLIRTPKGYRAVLADQSAERSDR